MKDLNKVMIIGRLGADPELRFTPAGSPVANFRVAAGRSWKGGDGATHEETEWFRVVAWNKLGEVCHSHLAKGSRVYVEGRIQTRRWQDEDGQERATSEVIASDMVMLDARRFDVAEPLDPFAEETVAASPDQPPPSRARTPAHPRSSQRAGARRATAPDEALPR